MGEHRREAGPAERIIVVGLPRPPLRGLGEGGVRPGREGGEAKDALMALTGQTSTYTPELKKVDSDQLWSTMVSATKDQRPMVSGTFDEKHQPTDYKAEDIIDEVATRIWHFEGDHRITDFKGAYEDYQSASV